MIRQLFLVLLSILPTSLLAEDTSKNFCLNKQAAIENEEFAMKYPEDEKVIMLVALRTGLCDLLAKEIIELDFAIGLYDEIETITTLERFQEGAQEKQEIESFGI